MRRLKHGTLRRGKEGRGGKVKSSRQAIEPLAAIVAA
jgi:hypothetical protein